MPAIAESFSGRSPVTGEEENVVLMTRFLTSGDAMTLTFVFPGEVYRSHAERTARIASGSRIEER